MNTDELLTILAQTKPPRPAVTFGPALCLLVVISFVMILFSLGLRQDLDTSIQQSGLWIKTGFLSCLLGVSFIGLRQSAHPLAGKDDIRLLYRGLWALLLTAGLYEMTQTPFTSLWHSWVSATGMTCVGFVLAYGMAAQIALVRVMRAFAPVDLTRAGQYIALAAAAAGALGYSIHCNMDNPAYVVVAYGLPTLLLGLSGRYILPAFLRW